MPIVVHLPFLKRIAKRRRLEIRRAPKLVKIGLLGALDLAVEMRGPGLDRSELDRELHEALLHLLGKELPAAIRLNPLDRKRHLLDHTVEKLEGVRRGSSGIRSEYTESAAIVDSGVLVEPRSDLAGVHLDPITGDWPIIPNDDFSVRERTLERPYIVPVKNRMQRR